MMDAGAIRSSAICIAKWSNDLLLDSAMVAARGEVPHRCVYTEGAPFKINSIRTELEALEAALKGRPERIPMAPRAA